MKILIFGASGSGTTTLAQTLSEKMNYTHLDADDYYWEKTDAPFEIKISFENRNKNLRTDFVKNKNTIVSGSLVTWEDYWDTAFDLAIFLRIPKDIRMERLRKREFERYKGELKTYEDIIEKADEFLKWAEKYDDKSFDGRGITQHENWIKLLNCETIKIEKDLTNDERMDIVFKKINLL